MATVTGPTHAEVRDRLLGEGSAELRGEYARLGPRRAAIAALVGAAGPPLPPACAGAGFGISPARRGERGERRWSDSFGALVEAVGAAGGLADAVVESQLREAMR